MSKSKNTDVANVAAPVTKTKKAKVEKVVGKRGRPVNTTSERQKRLAKFAAIVAAGGVVKRGRPATGKTVKPKATKKVKDVVVEPVAETVPTEKKKYVRPSRAKKPVVDSTPAVEA